MNLLNLSKFIEKVSFKIFGEEGQFSEIHNLIVDDDQVPLRYEGI